MSPVPFYIATFLLAGLVLALVWTLAPPGARPAVAIAVVSIAASAVLTIRALARRPPRAR